MAQRNEKRTKTAKRARRSFSEEFKQEAVQMLLDGHTAGSVAEILRTNEKAQAAAKPKAAKPHAAKPRAPKQRAGA